MSRLEQLRQQVNELVTERARIIREAEATITRANRTFDRLAVPLMREIRQLEPEAAKPTATNHKPTSSKPVTLEGLTDEEQKHYRQLQEKQNHGTTQ